MTSFEVPTAACALDSPQPEGVLDAGRIRRLKPSAFVVNVARGALLDEAALVDALRHGVERRVERHA